MSEAAQQRAADRMRSRKDKRSKAGTTKSARTTLANGLAKASDKLNQTKPVKRGETPEQNHRFFAAVVLGMIIATGWVILYGLGMSDLSMVQFPFQTGPIVGLTILVALFVPPMINNFKVWKANWSTREALLKLAFAASMGVLTLAWLWIAGTTGVSKWYWSLGADLWLVGVILGFIPLALAGIVVGRLSDDWVAAWAKKSNTKKSARTTTIVLTVLTILAYAYWGGFAITHGIL